MIAKKIVLSGENGVIAGLPQLSDFQIVEEELPNLEDGEILVQAKYISVDPIVRIALPEISLTEPIPGPQIGIVFESRCDEFPKGTTVLGKFGWRDFTVYKPEPNGPRTWRFITKLPDLKGLPLSYALGAVGMPGNAAYFGVTELLKPKHGETLLVTSAGGAVGSIVGQMGKMLGCYVIGVVGNEKKADWLKNELKFDAVLNYKTIQGNIEDAIKTIAPNGIDVYFDTVGGDFCFGVMNCMNDMGRIAQCGSIASYNNIASGFKLSIDGMNFRGKNLSLLAFNTGRWTDRWDEGLTQLRDWILDGKIKVRETMRKGFEETPQAFLDLLEGKNIGKQLVYM